MHCFLASRLLFRGQLLRRMPLPRAAVLGWSRGALKISPQPAEPRRVTLTLPSVSLLRGVWRSSFFLRSSPRLSTSWGCRRTRAWPCGSSWTGDGDSARSGGTGPGSCPPGSPGRLPHLRAGSPRGPPAAGCPLSSGTPPCDGPLETRGVAARGCQAHGQRLPRHTPGALCTATQKHRQPGQMLAVPCVCARALARSVGIHSGLQTPWSPGRATPRWWRKGQAQHGPQGRLVQRAPPHRTPVFIRSRRVFLVPQSFASHALSRT